MEHSLLTLPLETICQVLIHLTPHETLQFAKTSRLSSKIFNFDLQRIINQVIAEWSVLIFKCHKCKRAVRGGSEVTTTILSGMPPEEHLLRTCRKCYRGVRRDSMKELYQLLVTYRNDRDHDSLYRRLAYLGINRYQNSSNYPRKKDLDFMQTIVKQLFA